jgi:hypothetical protein
VRTSTLAILACFCQPPDNYTNIFVVSLELVSDAPSVEVDEILVMCLAQILQF